MGVTYTPAEGDGMFSFNATATAAFEFSETSTTLNLDVYRSTTSGAATVQITSTQLMGTQAVNVLNVPSELAFEDGQGRAVLSITANDNMEAATNYTVTISLGEGAVSPGGNQSITLTVSQAYTWISLGMGQFMDQNAYAMDLDGDGYLTTPEEFGIQEVEILKADGYDRWRIVNPWGNRDLIALGWGAENVLDEYSSFWEIYLVDDEGHIKWDGAMIPGIMYPDMDQILYYYPSEYYSAIAAWDEDIMYFENPGIFRLGAAGAIGDTGSYFTSPQSIYVAMPGVDLLEAVFGI